MKLRHGSTKAQDKCVVGCAVEQLFLRRERTRGQAKEFTCVLRDGPRLLRHRARASKPRLLTLDAPLWRRCTSLRLCSAARRGSHGQRTASSVTPRSALTDCPSPQVTPTWTCVSVHFYLFIFFRDYFFFYTAFSVLSGNS